MRDSIYAIAHIMLSPVRPSHGWIIQKRLKLGLRNFHRTVAHPSSFCVVSFIQKFYGVLPSGGIKQGRGG